MMRRSVAHLASASLAVTMAVGPAFAQQQQNPSEIPTAESGSSGTLPEVEVITEQAAEPTAPKPKKKKSTQASAPSQPNKSATSDGIPEPMGESVASDPFAANDSASAGGTSSSETASGSGAESATGPVNGIVAKRTATGTKTDTPLIETPQSVSVITADRIEQQRATTINEAVRYTPGVVANSFGIDTRFDWLNIRGFDAYQPGFFVDGMITRNNNSWAVWKVEPYGAERIEVLRGPASMLYGQGNVGGMINVISKRPLETSLNEVELRFGNHNRFETAFDFSGPVTTDGSLLYRLTGLYSDSDTQVDYTEQEEVFVAPAITWRPNAATSLTLLGQYRKDDTIPASGTYMPNPQAKKRRDLFVGEPDYDKFDRDQWSAGYILEHAFDSAWKVYHTARVASLDVDYKTLFSAGSPDGGITIDRSTFTSDETHLAFTTDTYVQSRFSTGIASHTLIAGVDYQRNYYEQQSGFGFAAAPRLNLDNPVYGTAVIVDPALYNDSDTVLEQTGLYIQDQAKIAERVIVTVGGRYDWAMTDFDDKLFAGDTVKNDEAFTWRGAVMYRDPSGLAPYYSYAQSFFPTGTVDPLSGQPFDPETGEQHEIGVKYEPSSFKGMFTAALFDITRQNFVTFDSAFVPSARGEVVSRGLELEATAELVPGLDVIATYSKLFELVTTQSSDPAEVGQTLPLVPLETASLWMHYRLQNGPMKGFGVGGGVRYIGESFGDLANSAAFSVPDFTLFDAVVDYELDAWRLALNVNNIEDELTYSCFDVCYLGTGRTVLGTIKYSW
ncbi:MAG: TonB-dependent siderophore receptor [Hyphomicrobium sp.]|nr:TonB-dependent siderophore receptor [Hyphomicrobium sp.]